MSNPVASVLRIFSAERQAAAAHLWSAVERLAPCGRRFVSVTYGADGSTRSRTHECVHAHAARYAAGGGAAPHVRRRTARGNCRHRAGLLAPRGTAHGRAARRSGPEGQAHRAAPAVWADMATPRIWCAV
jgi:hypothetical protein